MKLTFRADSWFPFNVPEAASASMVGPQTVYPVGMTLEQALQIYWRAKDYLMVASGVGVRSGVTQVLAVNQNLPPRNAVVGTDLYYEVDGFVPVGPGELVTGYGLRDVLAGTGTISASGTAGSGSNPAVFNLLVNLFYPETLAPDPVVRYGGQWWPAMSVSCAFSNTVTLSGGGALNTAFSCDTYNPASTTTIGTFSFFGTVVPVNCMGLAVGETRTFSGALSVSDEWS